MIISRGFQDFLIRLAKNFWSFLNSCYLNLQLRFCEITTVITVTLFILFKLKCISSIRVPKSKKKKLALTSFYFSCKNMIGWFMKTYSHKPIQILQFYNSFAGENSKKFNITSKFFSIFNDRPPASWVGYITRDFLQAVIHL